jgi:hypothetical protein
MLLHYSGKIYDVSSWASSLDNRPTGNRSSSLDEEGQGTQSYFEVKVIHLGQTGPLGSQTDEKSKTRGTETIKCIYSENGGNMFFQNARIHIPDYMVS